MRAATPTPTATTAEEWRRFDSCHICGSGRGRPCRNMKLDAGGADRHRPHTERFVVIDRNGAGVMILGRREHVTDSRPGTTHAAHAHHASSGGVAVCSGALIAEGTWAPLDELTVRQRCQRPACRRLWRAEAYR